MSIRSLYELWSRWDRCATASLDPSGCCKVSCALLALIDSRLAVDISEFAMRISRAIRCSLPVTGDFSQATLQLPYLTHAWMSPVGPAISTYVRAHSGVWMRARARALEICNGQRNRGATRSTAGFDQFIQPLVKVDPGLPAQYTPGLIGTHPRRHRVA